MWHVRIADVLRTTRVHTYAGDMAALMLQHESSGIRRCWAAVHPLVVLAASLSYTRTNDVHGNDCCIRASSIKCYVTSSCQPT